MGPELRMRAFLGEVDQLEVDALVCGATTDLCMDVGLAAQVKRAGGGEIEERVMGARGLEPAPAARRSGQALGGNHTFLASKRKTTGKGVSFLAVKVVIEAKEIRGLGYCKKLVVGQKWTYPDDVSGLCPFALNSLLPALFILQFGGRHPQSGYTGSEDTVVECCPDAMRPVVFQLTRIREEEAPRVEEKAAVQQPYIV